MTAATAEVVWCRGAWYVQWLDDRGFLVRVWGPYSWRCEAALAAKTPPQWIEEPTR